MRSSLFAKGRWSLQRPRWVLIVGECSTCGLRCMRDCRECELYRKEVFGEHEGDMNIRRDVRSGSGVL